MLWSSMLNLGIFLRLQSCSPLSPQGDLVLPSLCSPIHPTTQSFMKVCLPTGLSVPRRQQVLTKTHKVKEGRFLLHLMESLMTVSVDSALTCSGESALEQEEIFYRDEESSQSFPFESLEGWPGLSSRSLVFMCRKGGVSSVPITMS